MEFYDVINKRRTVREFNSRSIPEDSLKRILDAGLKAPSSDHLRQWSPVVITDRNRISEIAACIKDYPCNIQTPQTPQQEMFKIAFPRQHSMIESAGCLVLPYFKQSSSLYKPENVYTLINYGAAWAFIENILLASTAEGLGCAIHIPVGDENKDVQNIVKPASNYILPAIIAIGIPIDSAEIPTQVSAKVEDKVRWNKW